MAGPLPSVHIRSARPEDLAAIVALLADDQLGAGRESPDLDDYLVALAEILADPRHELLVGDDAGRVVAVLQLTILPCLTHGGRRRAQLEGVRVARDLRGAGVGRVLVLDAIDRARNADCGVVQLTTDATRPEALHFYEDLGFEPTHVGLKLPLA